MVETTKIAAEPRERAGKGAARAVRRTGRVPGVIYGDKQSPQLISLDPKDVDREIHKPGFTTHLFDIAVGGKTVRALPRDVQLDPVTDRPEHVDFMRVTETSKIKVMVPVRFLNNDKSPGLKRGGVLNVVRHDIEVWCTVASIPRQIEVDLDGLDIGDSVHINAVKLPEGVKPTIARNFTVAAVAAPSVLKTAEEEAAEAAAKAAAAAEAAGLAPPGAEGAVPGAAPGAPGAPGAAPAAGAPAAAPGAKPAAGAAPGAKPAAGAAPAAPARGGPQKK